MATTIVIVSIIVINILFGYWRANTRRLTLQWIMAIHMPVPIAIWLRLVFVGWNWLMLPVFIAAFAAGQYAGGEIRRLLQKQSISLSSFLILDLYRILAARVNSKLSED